MGMFILLLLWTAYYNSSTTSNDLHPLPMLFFPTTAIGDVHIHRHFSRPIVYYPNTTSTRQILVGGDIETNPGPPSKAAVCANCERSIRRDHRRSSCSTCQEPLHLKGVSSLFRRVVIPKGHYSENTMTVIIPKGHYSENNIRVIIPKIT